MKEKNFSLKYLGIGILTILSYFLISNFLMLVIQALRPSKVASTIVIYYFLVTFIALLIYIIIFKKQILIDFKDFKKNYKKYIPIAFNYWIKGFFIMIVSNLILNYILKTSQSVNQLENIALLKSNLVVHSITVILIAPFIEELVFRLSFNKMTNNKHIFSFITGTIFGLIHIITSISLKNPLNILLLIPYSAMGVALGYTYKETKNIFSSTVIHMFHNLLNVIIIIISIKGGIM